MYLIFTHRCLVITETVVLWEEHQPSHQNNWASVLALPQLTVTLVHCPEPRLPLVFLYKTCTKTYLVGLSGSSVKIIICTSAQSPMPET